VTDVGGMSPARIAEAIAELRQPARTVAETAVRVRNLDRKIMHSAMRARRQAERFIEHANARKRAPLRLCRWGLCPRFEKWGGLCHYHAKASRALLKSAGRFDRQQ